MENSPLNKAHQQHRKANSHLRHFRYTEAIECHKNAADLLEDALTCTQNSRALESIKLQRNFHLRQKDIILTKKEQHENLKRTIENQRNCPNYTNDFKSNDNINIELKSEIRRTMDEADSLLVLLVKRGNGGNSDCESANSYSTTDTDEKAVVLDTIDSSNSNTPMVGSKHPKDDSVVIEELRFLNEHLHSLVSKLVTQLDASTKEIEALRERVKELENEKIKAQTKPCTNNLKVILDSSGGTSPYVYSPCSEFSPDVPDQRVLPALAPLEMPPFDFTNFVKNNSNPNTNINKL